MFDFWILISIIFLGQTLGSLLGLIGKPSDKFLRLSLAFAASMMISISFFELIPEALELVTIGEVLLFFMFGIGVLKLIDLIIPHSHSDVPSYRLKRCIIMLTLGMALHNIPEGLAVGISFARDTSMGLSVAISMAVQDVPENIAAIIPIHNFTQNGLQSFGIISFTILFQFIGFLVGYFLFKGASNIWLGVSLAIAAGFMTYISIHELLPEAKLEKDKGLKASVIVFGIIVVLMMKLFSYLL